jgi:hypothetical protein
MTCRSKSYTCLGIRSALFIKSPPDRVAQCRVKGLISENSAMNCITLENEIFANRIATVDLNALHEFRQWVIDKIPLRFMHRVMLLAECECVGKTIKFESVLRQHGRHPLHLSHLAPSCKTALYLAFWHYGNTEVDLWHRVCSYGHYINLLTYYDNYKIVLIIYFCYHLLSIFYRND